MTTQRATVTTQRSTTRSTTTKSKATTASCLLSKIRYCSQNPKNSSFKKGDWKNTNGGYYNYRAGCAVACTVMALSSLGRNYLPKDICKWNGDQVNMKWSNVAKMANVKLDKKGTGANPPYEDDVLSVKIKNYQNNPSKYAPVIIWMENESHYVLLTNRISSGNYECLDPMDSGRKSIRPKMKKVKQYVQFYT